MNLPEMAVYVVGAPGSGKSTLMRALGDLLGNGERVQRETPVPHVEVGNGWVELGRDRGAFGGTDALGYAISPRAVAWITSEGRPPALLGEGDRLATDTFLGALRQSYPAHVIVFLEGDPAIAWTRAQDRADALGRPMQNESWWRGRATKAARLADRHEALRLHMKMPTAEQVDWITTALVARVESARQSTG